MHKGITTFLYDTGEWFQDSWDFNVPASDEALKRLNQVAQTRLPLLASCVRIVRLKVTGQPQQRVSWRGSGGGWSMPREALTLRHEGGTTGKRLRGVPKGIFDGRGLTPRGVVEFNQFNRVLNQSGCMIVHKGQAPEPVTRLQPRSLSVLSWKWGKKASLKELIALLGRDEARRFWDGLKKK